MDIIEFLHEGYWSKDYVVEIDGFKKIAKFVDKKLITRTSEVILKSELGRNVKGLLVPEIFDFEQESEYIFVYSIPYYTRYDEYQEKDERMVFSSLISTLRSLLHIPGLYIPFLGGDDLVIVDGEVKVFLPLAQDLQLLLSGKSKYKFFEAPELLNGELTDKSTIYVFGKLLSEFVESAEIKEMINPMLKELPNERVFNEDVPFQYIPESKKTLLVRRIKRDEEDEVMSLILQQQPETKFIGVIGPQRVGKTTMIENIQNQFRQLNIPFMHVTSGFDIVVQTLQLVSEKIPEKLLERISYCLENVCTMDTISLDIVEALQYLEKVVIFVDDYQEASERLKAFLRKIVQINKTGNIKILAFSVEDSEDFGTKLFLKPFSKVLISRLLEHSLGETEKRDVFAEWLYYSTEGLPGVIVEYLRYLYEVDILRKEHGKYVIDIDRLSEVNIGAFVSNRAESFKNTKERYVAILGQKFVEEEIRKLESLIGAEIDLSALYKSGILYREYDKIRFTLKQYWEVLYQSIPDDEKKELHEKLSNILTDYEKRAMHLEAIGREISAAKVYLEYVREMMMYYASPSVIYSILRKVKKLTGNKISYALVKYTVELCERTEDTSYCTDLEIPDSKLYAYYLSLRHYINYEYDKAIEVLSKNNNSDGYGKIGYIKRNMLKLKSEFEKGHARGDFYEKLKELVNGLDLKNSEYAKVLVDYHIFLGLLFADNSPKAIENLRKAEKIALDFNVAHRLPTIYNNLAVQMSNTAITMEYLERSVKAAENIGLPARSYMARINMLYNELYAGKIREFVEGIIDIRKKVEMLNLRNEYIYANSLEAYYHAYNFELEEALEHLKACREKYKLDMKADECAVYMITRQYDKLKELLPDAIRSDETEEEVRKAMEVVSSFENEDFAANWEKYVNAGGRVVREEFAAVFGRRLAEEAPEAFKRELEYLESTFTLDGSTLSLAMTYEGYGHYYFVKDSEYKAKTYYSKAVTIYKDIGLLNAAKNLAQIYNVRYDTNEDYFEKKDFQKFAYDLLSSLKAVDPKTDPQRLLSYFASKIINVLPVKDLKITLSDNVLDKTYEVSIGEVDESQNGEYIQTAPLKVQIEDYIDKDARYKFIIQNNNVKLPDDYRLQILPVLELIEYAMTAVLKGTLSRLRSLIDPLTKLYTRYYFSDVLLYYFEKAFNEKGELTVVMCDIDNFKKINDTYGHLTGDEVLKEIAKVLREHVRTTDVVGRFGGEEFIILFPSTGLDDAISVVERLRRHIREIAKFPFNITLSFGVANYPKCQVFKSEELIQKADIALYNAKNTGKNKIVVYTEGMTGGLHA
ncbi:MAG: diguanylate cyclase [Fervidobacterium sp.]|uniref:diguanylate cyclase n=1 Tax=Fervidobacterium sp. TaxID=1871331 RepID=UPI00404B481B